MAHNLRGKFSPACSISARQGRLLMRLSTWPRTHSDLRARVKPTFMRRTSCRNPTPLVLEPPALPPLPCHGARTQESSTTSASRPWNASTVATSTNAAAAGWRRSDRSLCLMKFTCASQGSGYQCQVRITVEFREGVRHIRKGHTRRAAQACCGLTGKPDSPSAPLAPWTVVESVLRELLWHHSVHVNCAAHGTPTCTLKNWVQVQPHVNMDACLPRRGRRASPSQMRPGATDLGLVCGDDGNRTDVRKLVIVEEEVEKREDELDLLVVHERPAALAALLPAALHVKECEGTQAGLHTSNPAVCPDTRGAGMP